MPFIKQMSLCLPCHWVILKYLPVLCSPDSRLPFHHGKSEKPTNERCDYRVQTSHLKAFTTNLMTIWPSWEWARVKNSLSVGNCCLRAWLRLRTLKEPGSMASSPNGRKPHVQACATSTHFTFSERRLMCGHMPRRDGLPCLFLFLFYTLSV